LINITVVCGSQTISTCAPRSALSFVSAELQHPNNLSKCRAKAFVRGDR